jgi:cell wall-active antibiotic response 4TMS protein YvqF
MNRSALFFQAIRGPILLITIGVLFALEQAGKIAFTRTWPLILIVIGLMKLLERMAAAPPMMPPPGGPLR